MKKIEKKLSLKKELIANLNKMNLAEIKGGETNTVGCPTYYATACGTTLKCVSQPSNPGTTISADC